MTSSSRPPVETPASACAWSPPSKARPSGRRRTSKDERRPRAEQSTFARAGFVRERRPETGEAGIYIFSYRCLETQRQSCFNNLCLSLNAGAKICNFAVPGQPKVVNIKDNTFRPQMLVILSSLELILSRSHREQTFWSRTIRSGQIRFRSLETDG